MKKVGEFNIRVIYVDESYGLMIYGKVKRGIILKDDYIEITTRNKTEKLDIIEVEGKRWPNKKSDNTILFIISISEEYAREIERSGSLNKTVDIYREKNKLSSWLSWILLKLF